MSNDSLKKQKYKLLDGLLEKCYIDALTGQFYCKKCKTAVHVDWHENLAFCPVHGVLV